MSGVFEEPKGKILPGKKATSILIDRQKINRIAESHDLHDFDTFQNKVLPDLGDLFDFQAASFHLFDPLHATLNAEGNFIKAAFQNTTLKTFKFEDIAFCDSPLETIRKLSEPTFFDTNYWINEYPEYLRSGLLTNVYKYQCIIPLLYRQEIFGVLIFYSGIQGFCEDLNPELLQCLTGQFSLTLQLLLSEQKNS